MNRRKSTASEKLHLLIAGLALCLSFLVILLGLLTKEGFIGFEFWDVVFMSSAVPQSLGLKLLTWGLISLPFTLIWNVWARFALR